MANPHPAPRRLPLSVRLSSRRSPRDRVRGQAHLAHPSPGVSGEGLGMRVNCELRSTASQNSLGNLFLDLLSYLYPSHITKVKHLPTNPDNKNQSKVLKSKSLKSNTKSRESKTRNPPRHLPPSKSVKSLKVQKSKVKCQEP